VITQETEGLVSPLLTRIRLRQVASCIKPNSAVLDLACGAGYLSRFLPAGCRYYGVDRVPEPSQNTFAGFISLDLMQPDSVDRVRDWLPEKPDYVACVAFIEHITNPTGFLREYSRLLHKPGAIVGTTPHPSGRVIHDSLSKVRITSPHGAAEHEKFFGRHEIEQMAAGSGGHLNRFNTFLFGLNQLFTIEYR
jgi:2-polyprenyl-3-methyl-5-hydroxy-6-metoxy-1,4-benzoquinol methylase